MRYFTPILILILALLPLFSIAIKLSEKRLNVTLETCLTRDDCRTDLPCTSSNNAVCQGDQDVECRCRPIDAEDAIKCSMKDLTCPLDEGCAQHPTIDLKFCAACTVILDPASKYKPVSAEVCQIRPSQSPTPSPQPLRNSLDFCGIYDACRSDLLCKNDIGANVLCNRNSIKCQCWPKTISSCSSSSECNHVQEVCVRDTFSNQTYCAACNKFNSDATLVLASNDDSNRCKNQDKLQIPRYWPLSGGQSFDLCTDKDQCQDPLECQSISKNNKFSKSCEPVSSSEQSCSMTKPNTCPQGETCAIANGISESPTCISISRISQEQWEGKTVEMLGEIPEQGDIGTGNTCKADWQCRKGLRCVQPGASQDFLDLSCIWGEACSCEAMSPEPCINDNECAIGEVCVNYPGALSRPFCLSAVAVPKRRLVQLVNNINQTAFNSGDGWTGDSCVSSDHCVQGDDPRVCRHVTEDFGECESDRAGCICTFSESKVCSYTKDCGDGEACVAPMGSTRGKGECMSRKFIESLGDFSIYLELDFGKRGLVSSSSPTTSPSPSEKSASELFEDSAVPSEEPSTCISWDLLGKISEANLVFKKHQRASVLCDTDDSCATPGHMVLWNNRPMRMKVYCEIVGNCVSRVKFVNSPRMKKAVRIASKTNGLTMTAFAARFNTQAEEILLSSLLRFGL